MIVLGKAAGTRILGKYHGKATKEELEDLLEQLEHAVQNRGSITLDNLVVLTGKTSGTKADYVVEYEEGALIVPHLRAYLERVENGTEAQCDLIQGENFDFSLS
jgi:hypothetical protein